MEGQSSGERRHKSIFLLREEVAQHKGGILASYPAAPGSIFQHVFRGKMINVAEVSQPRWFEESGQWLENVDPIHQALASGHRDLYASGKPVLQKTPKNQKKPKSIAYHQKLNWRGA